MRSHDSLAFDSLVQPVHVKGTSKSHLINGGARLCAKRQPQQVARSLRFDLAAAVLRTQPRSLAIDEMASNLHMTTCTLTSSDKSYHHFKSRPRRKECSKPESQRDSPTGGERRA